MWVRGTKASCVATHPSLRSFLVFFPYVYQLQQKPHLNMYIRQVSITQDWAQHTMLVVSHIYTRISPSYSTATSTKILTRTWLTFEMVVSFNFSITGTSIWLLVIWPKWILIEKQYQALSQRIVVLATPPRTSNKNNIKAKKKKNHLTHHGNIEMLLAKRAKEVSSLLFSSI